MYFRSSGSPKSCQRGKCCANPGDGDNASPFQHDSVGTSLLSKNWSVAVLALPFQQESLSKKHLPSRKLIKESF